MHAREKMRMSFPPNAVSRCTYVYGHKIRDKIDRQSKTLQSGLIVI